MNSEYYQPAIAALIKQAEATRQRRLLVLSGGREWATACALQTVETLNVKRALWLGEKPKNITNSEGVEWTTAKKAIRHLGSERALIVMDAYAGFHPDGFGAISGTLVAGGLFILITPDTGRWAEYDDPDYERITPLPFTRSALKRRFISRISDAIQSSDHILHLCEGCTPPNELLLPPKNTPVREVTLSDGCITKDQQRAVEGISKVVTGHRRRPLVITSDRGRGKSAALGLAAAKLIKTGVRRIVLTAPYIESVDSAFAMLAAQFPQGIRQGSRFSTQQSDIHEVTFIAPDELVASLPEADLVLVDEAAAIPTPMLESLLARYSRIVFATTIHGYEGTGRGFAVRFTKVLDRLTPQWKSLHLKSPIRWAEGDPLETFVFESLLLNTSLDDPVVTTKIDKNQLQIKWLDQDMLVKDSALLEQVFGLLVLAHYRTSPDDLRMLLDGPSLRIAALYYHSDIVAVAWVIREGGLNPALGEAIWQGRRRPRGHLIPQVLSSYSGFREATDLKGDRVMRVAVHPKLHQMGLGTVLIDGIYQRSVSDQVDYLGASFGATSELLTFWTTIGFTPVRLGLQRDASSGEHSVVVMKPISARAVALCDEAAGRFNHQFYFDLSDGFSELSTNLVLRLLNSSDEKDWLLNERDLAELTAFTTHKRVYESCSLVVAKCVMLAVIQQRIKSSCNTQEIHVLIRRVIQKNKPQKVIAELNLNGKKQLDEILRQATQKLHEY